MVSNQNFPQKLLYEKLTPNQGGAKNARKIPVAASQSLWKLQ